MPAQCRIDVRLLHCLGGVGFGLHPAQIVAVDRRGQPRRPLGERLTLDVGDRPVRHRRRLRLTGVVRPGHRAVGVHLRMPVPGSFEVVVVLAQALQIPCRRHAEVVRVIAGDIPRTRALCGAHPGCPLRLATAQPIQVHAQRKEVPVVGVDQRVLRRIGVEVDHVVDLAPVGGHIAPREPALPVPAAHTGLLRLRRRVTARLRVGGEADNCGTCQPFLADVLRQPAGAIEPHLDVVFVGVTVDVDVHGDLGSREVATGHRDHRIGV